MGVHQLLEPLLERLHSSASVKTIYGEPIEVAGKTLIPIAKVAYGLGGAASARRRFIIKTDGLRRSHRARAVVLESGSCRWEFSK